MQCLDMFYFLAYGSGCTLIVYLNVIVKHEFDYFKTRICFRTEATIR